MLPQNTDAPKRSPMLLPCAKGKPIPQTSKPHERPAVESLHHSVSETITLGNASMKKSAPITIPHDKPSCRAQKVKPTPKPTTMSVSSLTCAPIRLRCSVVALLLRMLRKGRPSQQASTRQLPQG